MKHRNVLMVCVLGAVMVACAKEPEPRSVQFFKDHPEERDATLQRCKTQTTESKDCENAATAGLIDAQREPIPKPKFPTQPAQ